MFKVNNKNTTATSILVFLLTLNIFHRNTFFFGFSTVDSEKANVSWVKPGTTSRGSYHHKFPTRRGKDLNEHRI